MRIMLLTFMLVFSSFAKAETVWYPLPKEAYSFGKDYPEAQKLLYAFDYGHALVYERLLINKGKITDPELFEKELLIDIFKILKNPPDVKNDEGDIAPNYVYQFPLTITLFDWSHMLHQFVLDVLATSDDRGDGMKNRINELYTQYKANKPIAITEVCKSMLFMDAHYFSKSFRQNYPSFNLLIWSYHWFQIKLYEALMAPTKEQRDANVKKTIKDFWQLVSDLPDSADFDMMPETAKEAPTFAKMFPKIPGAFDNNHMLHDIVSDILTSDKVPMPKIKTEGMRFSLMDLDPEAFKSTSCGL
jgi:hypothetical protein